jgi:hypothetical protein
MSLNPSYSASPPNCDKCGKATSLLTVIPRLGDTPAYRIFECLSCNVLQWIAFSPSWNQVVP